MDLGDLNTALSFHYRWKGVPRTITLGEVIRTPAIVHRLTFADLSTAAFFILGIGPTLILLI